MIKNLFILPGGEELYSGAADTAAIRSVTITQQVNSEEELAPGSVCAGLLEATVFAPAGFSLAAGETVTAYKVDAGGKRTQVGIFIAEKPQRQSANVYKFTAYDRVSLLDRDLSQWLAQLQGWPYSLQELAQLVCEQCGLELATPEFPNSGFPVQAFSAQDITGRKLMEWIAQAAGRFCRATADGALELAWYTPNAAWAVGPAAAEGVIPYYQGSLTYEDYATAPIEKVQVRLTEEDVGAVYPDTAQAVNTYILSGNYLLTTSDPEALQAVAQTLYEQLKDTAYTPCQVSVPANLEIRAGDIITLTDANGKALTVYVMRKTQEGQRDTLQCTGSPRRDSSTAVNNQSIKALSGKVLNLRTDVEGLKAENRDASGKITGLQLDVDGIRTSVSQQSQSVEGIREQMTALTQDTRSLSIQVQDIQENGASRVKTEMGYTFDDTGLTIRKSGQEMENRLDHTGMYVERSGEAILQANNAGVTAMDVTVRNYLIVGEHARFEDYTDGTDSKRTACFYMEEGSYGA